MDLGFDLRYYMSLLRRRFFYVFIPFLLIAGGSAAVALKLPPIYKSTGKILVESQQIPDDLVRSTVTSYADERIEIIKQRVMTRENLLRIVEKFKLFESRGSELSNTEIVDAMQNSIEVAPVTSGLAGLRRRAGTTIAFTVSVEHEYPHVAVQVANELVTLFLDENVRTRTSRAAETTEFLEQESGKLKNQVDAIEAQIADYKQQYSESLPEHVELRISMLERAQAELKETEREIKAIEAERRFLNIQMDAIKAGFAVDGAVRRDGIDALTPEQELKRLQVELLEKSAVYNSTHPDIVILERRVTALKKRVKSVVTRKDMEDRLRELRIQLKEAQSRFAAGHPEVQMLNKEIGSLTERLAVLGPDVPGGSGKADAIDPIRANVSVQLDIAAGKLTSLSAQREALKKKISSLEAMIIQTPQVERGLRSLSRDYQNALAKYEEVKAKAMEAKLAENLEEDKKAERFSLLEPPVQPEEPVKPNRRKLLAIGLALAAAAGGGGLFLIESIDGSIRGTAGYIAMLKQRPLISIPYIVTPREVRRRRRLFLSALLLIVLAIGATLVAVHFYYKPLDILWYKVVDRLQWISG